jgi:hypothetical protein
MAYLTVEVKENQKDYGIAFLHGSTKPFLINQRYTTQKYVNIPDISKAELSRLLFHLQTKLRQDGYGFVNSSLVVWKTKKSIKNEYSIFVDKVLKYTKNYCDRERIKSIIY